MVETVEDFISSEIAVSLLTVVCHNVAVEPKVQPLSGEWFQHKTSNINDGAHLDDGVRLDVCAQGFWADKHQGAFFNIKVFKPYKPSSCKFTTESVYRRHDGEKRHSYERRILEVEYGTFTTSVLGSGLDGSTSNSHIQATSLPPGWETRTVVLNISLLRLSFTCIRGSRSSTNSACRMAAVSGGLVDLDAREGRITSTSMLIFIHLSLPRVCTLGSMYI